MYTTQADLAYNFEDSQPFSGYRPLIDAKIGIVSFVSLTLLCLILTYASVKNIGNYGMMAVMGYVFVICLMRPADIILIWLTFLYNPELLAGSGTPNFKITIAISFSICLLYGKFTVRRLINKAMIGYICFLAWLLLTVLIAPDLSGAFAYYWRLLKSVFIMVLLFNLVTTEEEMGRVLKWWAIVAALSIIPAFVHYVLGPDTWLYHVYEITGARATTERSLVYISGDTTKRLIWAGLDPNGRGATLLFPFGIALAYLMSSRARNKTFWAFILGVIAVCILGSFSRSSFLCLIILLTVFAFAMNVRAIIPIMFAYATGMFALLLLPAVRERIMSIHESIVATGGTGRFYYWKQAISQWMGSPLFGKGLRSFFVLVKQETHNSYLELLADTGFIGCLIFSVLMGMACLWAFNCTKDREDIRPVFGKTLACGMFSLCAMIGTVTLYSEMQLWLAFAVCFMLYQFQKQNLLYHHEWNCSGYE